MCGIAGRAGAGAADVVALRRMADGMVQRGPDGEGIWHDDTVGLAFRRLAIIDLHERSNQPLHLGDLHLVFNGEIYNYVELRDELLGLGHGFVTKGDGEVLIHAWAQWGEGALDRFDGMFAFAVWDGAARRLTLAVDRFAEKPLLFHAERDRLIFASSVRAIRAADPTLGTPDPVATDRFLALGTMPSLPSTFYADLQRLSPACLAHWSPGSGLTVRHWWEPATVEVPRHPADAAHMLRNLLRKSIARRLRSDVPVGTSLSGGVDSSAILSLTADVSRDVHRHAFTATFPGFARDEWSYAAAAASAAHVAQHHAVTPTMAELFDDLPALVADQEEPFGSTSIYAQWRVMRCAREAGVVVLLDGQGGDELFGGYDGIAGWALRTRGPAAALGGLLRDPGLARSVATAYAAGRAPEPLARRYRLRRASPYVDHRVAHEASAHAAEAQLEWTAGRTALQRELLTQAFATALPHLCRFADRDSMAWSVEVRLPFLDREVAEFAFSLPPDLVWHEGVSKRLLRDTVRGLVPDEILDRRDKVAYETPESEWFGSVAGRERVAEILLDRGARGTYERAEVQRDLSAGTWRDPRGVWRAANVALWLGSGQC